MIAMLSADPKRFNHMRLIDLKPGDRFYFQGIKYAVFMTLKDDRKHYLVPCYEWPQGEYVDIDSRFEVKKIMKVSICYSTQQQ